MKRITVLAEHPDGSANAVQAIRDDDSPETIASVRAMLPPYPPGTVVTVTIDEHRKGELW